MAKPKTQNPASVPVFVWGILSFLGAVGVAAAAFPYFLVPSDDRSFLLDDRASPRPVLILALRAFQALCRGLNLAEPNAWLFLNTTALFLILFLAACLLWKETCSRYATSLCLVILATSSWTATYFYWASYTLFGTALLFGTVFLAVLAANQTPRRRALPFVGAGMLLGLSFWVTPTGPLEALTVGLALVFSRQTRREDWLWILGGLGLSLIPFAPEALPRLLFHWQDNRAAMGAAKGAGVTYPYGIFFRVLGVEHPLAIAFSAAILVSPLKKVRPWALALLAAALFRAFLIEAMPFTKLGRSFFPSFALAVVGLSFWLEKIPKKRSVFFAALVGTIATQGVFIHFKLREQKQSVFHLVQKEAPVSLSAADPHAWHFQESLTLSQLPISSSAKTLLIGPRGPGTTYSALLGGRSSDNPLTDSKLTELGWHKAAEVPFYSLTPAFLMESEVAQAVYFQASVPVLSAVTLWKRP